MRAELAPDASNTLIKAHERSRKRGRDIASQDIAVVLAKGPFSEAFGDHETRARVVSALDDWAHFGSLLDNTSEVISRALQNARTHGRATAENIDLLAAVINPTGDPIEPLTLLSGDAEDPYKYRMGVLKRASEMATSPQFEQLQRAG